MSNQVSTTYPVAGYEVTVLTHGERSPHFWLNLEDGIKVPLATVYDPEGGAYCYITSNKFGYTEWRLYSTGEVVTI